MRSFVLLLAGAFSAFASVDSGLLALVPSGAKIVGSLDVTQARNSDFGHYLLSKAQNEDAHFQEMISATGFDPRRDLQSVIFATGAPTASGKPESFAILARGNFDVARIKALATAKGATVVSYQGVDMLMQQGKNQTAIGFPDVGIAAMADVTTLKAIIAGRSTPSILDAALQSKIHQVSGSNDAWYVSLVGGGALANHMSGGDVPSPAKAMQGVVSSSGGVKLGSAIEISFDAATRSDKDASSLADVIRMMSSMVQMNRQKDARAGIVASALDSMVLQSTGNAVHFGLNFPEKSLEQLAALLHEVSANGQN